MVTIMVLLDFHTESAIKGTLQVIIGGSTQVNMQFSNYCKSIKKKLKIGLFVRGLSCKPNIYVS